MSSADAPDGFVRTTQDGAVLTVTLDRPEQLNAQTPATWSTLAAVGAALDDSVRVVVLRGSGRSFSAGLDRSMFDPEPGTAGGLGDLGRRPSQEAEEQIREYQRGFRWLRAPGIVSIAAVQGHAIGAGCQLALACDLRVAAEDAQFRLPEPTLGLVPDLTGTSNLVELIGYSRAMEICLTGRPVGAVEAHAMGLANVVVPREQLDDAVARLTQAILGPPVAAGRATAALVRSAVRNDPETQDAAERKAQVLRLQELAAGR